MRGFASRIRWDRSGADRLAAAGEETLAILAQKDQEETDAAPRRLTIAARREGHAVELEFVAALESDNVEDRLSYLSALPPVPDDGEVSIRLLRHYASQVRHQQYHGLDVITVQVAGGD